MLPAAIRTYKCERGLDGLTGLYGLITANHTPMMSWMVYRIGMCVVLSSLLLMGACDQRSTSESGNFTKADSLTETYLALQDTMLQAWNSMIHDDNRKIKAMHRLLEEMKRSNPENLPELESLEARLEQLASLRYDQTSITNPELVSEYDFASNSLVTEIIVLAESQRDFATDQLLQELVDSIRAADQRIMNYRQEYDRTASRFNAFIDRNKEVLHEIDSQTFLQKKPLFEMAAE